MKGEAFPRVSEFHCECGFQTVAPSSSKRMCPNCSKGHAVVYCTERKPKAARAKMATPAQVDELKKRFSA